MQQSEHKKRAFALLQMPELLSSFQYSLFKLSVDEVNWGKWTFNANDKRVRFGHYMEALFAACLNASYRYKIIEQNVQLIANGITEGELDFLVFDEQEHQYLHIELACKFFLHVPDTLSEERFIGPNKRDRLDLKLKKLSEKQFPNLFSKTAELFLNQHNIKAKNIAQHLALKGMIFTEWEDTIIFKSIHPKSVSGKWISVHAFDTLDNSSNLFSFPKKLDWIMPVQNKMKWNTFKEALQILNTYKQLGKNPMLWLKQKEDQFVRLFVLD